MSRRRLLKPPRNIRRLHDPEYDPPTGGLACSAATDSCGMALALSKLPYNRVASCDVREVVARLGNVTV